MNFNFILECASDKSFIILQKKNQPDSSQQGQAQGLGLGLSYMDFGLLLWTEDASELPTGPPTITKTLKIFL